MNKLLRAGILTAFAGALSFVGAAQADEATTSGGFKIKTDDGKFDATIGGRVHFDGLVNLPADKPFGSSAAAATSDTKSDFEFRRVYINLGGHLYGFEYKVEYDLAASNFQDLYIAHPLFGGTLYAGQHKPWRSLDEMASNNATPFLERNYTSSSNGGSGGIYGGNDYQEGVFYSWNRSIGIVTGDNVWAGASVYSLHKQAAAAQARTQGTGYNGRIAYAPFTDKTGWLHFGASFSNDNLDSGSTVAALSPNFLYAGRIGPSITLASYSSVATGSSGNPHADIAQGELAGVIGPFYGQGEFARAGYHKTGVNANNVNAYSATLAWTLTGESRSYDAKNATYGAIKPKGPLGAVELAVRYDAARNTSGASKAVGDATSYGATAVPLAGATKLSASSLTVGLNYYVNPAVRFVVDYQHGRASIGTAQDTSSAVGARVQLVF